MAHAEVCPICHGKGVIPDEGGTSSVKTCHGCNGCGWVEVADFPYYLPVPYPEPYPPFWGEPVYFCY
jgi:hypothetical protein